MSLPILCHIQGMREIKTIPHITLARFVYKSCLLQHQVAFTQFYTWNLSLRICFTKKCWAEHLSQPTAHITQKRQEFLRPHQCSCCSHPCYSLSPLPQNGKVEGSPFWNTGGNPAQWRCLNAQRAKISSCTGTIAMPPTETTLKTSGTFSWFFFFFKGVAAAVLGGSQRYDLIIICWTVPHLIQFQ